MGPYLSAQLLEATIALIAFVGLFACARHPSVEWQNGRLSPTQENVCQVNPHGWVLHSFLPQAFAMLFHSPGIFPSPPHQVDYDAYGWCPPVRVGSSGLFTGTGNRLRKFLLCSKGVVRHGRCDQEKRGL